MEKVISESKMRKLKEQRSELMRNVIIRGLDYIDKESEYQTLRKTDRLLRQAVSTVKGLI